MVAQKHIGRFQPLHIDLLNFIFFADQGEFTQDPDQPCEHKRLADGIFCGFISFFILYTLSFKQTEKLSSRAARAPVYDKVDISITLPYKVTSHNADKVHKNTYTWEIATDEKITATYYSSNKATIEATYNKDELKNNKIYFTLLTYSSKHTFCRYITSAIFLSSKLYLSSIKL